MRQPTAKSLTLDLLSTLSGRSLPIAALVAAGELLGLAEGSLRVAVTRLLAAGRIERDERGLYRLGSAAAPIDREVRSWRRLEERTRRWSGAWLAVHRSSPAPRGARRRAEERALRWMGLAELEPGFFVRPDNLKGGAKALRPSLLGLGLDPGALVLRADGLDPAREARARGLWDVPALEAAYDRGVESLLRSEARLETLAEGEAMVESFRLGGEMIRLLVLDPLLPAPLVDVDERRRLVRAMRRYDRVGRRAWAGFMESHGAPTARAPVHTDGGAALPMAHGELQ